MVADKRTIFVSGSLIAQLRRDLGWNQDDLAGKAEVKSSAIKRIEQTGDTSVYLATARSIAECLGVPLAQITVQVPVLKPDPRDAVVPRPELAAQDAALGSRRAGEADGTPGVQTVTMSELISRASAANPDDYEPEEREQLAKELARLSELFKGGGGGGGTPPARKRK